MKIIINQDQMNLYNEYTKVFLRDVLGIDLHKAFLTNITDLSDFCYHLHKDVQVKYNGSEKQNIKLWDKVALKRIKDLYGITCTNTVVRILSILKEMETIGKVIDGEFVKNKPN